MKINICCIGDPLSPKTWSGTPFNICKELEKKNFLGDAFSTNIRLQGRLSKLADSFLNRYYTGSKDLERGFLYRYLRANYARMCTAKSSWTHTLHLGTLDLPFFIAPRHQFHYLYIDSTWHLWSTNATNMSGYKSRLLKHAEQLEKKSYNQAKHIFTISAYVKENLIQHYGIQKEKITVAGTGRGVIQPYFGEKDYSKGKLLFTAKDRFEDKGGPLVIEAFKKAYTLNNELELIIVGQDDNLQKIKHPGITVYGYLPLNELQALFNDSCLFVMPAGNEPWGLVYLEALACKMPIIGLNKNSFPEISGYGKYGFSVSETSESLSNIFITALSNPNLLRKMGDEGQTFCLNKFTWHNTIKTIIDTINNIRNN
jgi:glycosyltransferase involved in cell wall biosynthesis